MEDKRNLSELMLRNRAPKLRGPYVPQNPQDLKKHNEYLESVGLKSQEKPEIPYWARPGYEIHEELRSISKKREEKARYDTKRIEENKRQSKQTA